MKFTKQLRHIFIFVIIFTFNSAAQDTLLLDLSESVHLALRQNPALGIAEKEVDKSRAGVWEAYATILPTLDGYASLQHSWEIQTSRIPNFLKPMLAPLSATIPGIDQMPDFVDIAFGLENTARYGATVTQPLFLGGAGIAGIQAAKAGSRVAQENLALTRQALIFESARAFHACLLAKELVTVQEEALAQARATFDVIDKKFNTGMASRFERMRAEVDVANLEPEVVSAQNNYRLALTQLRTVLGLNRDTAVAIAGQFHFEADALAETPLRELQTIALAERPEMHAMAAQKAIAQQGIRIARSNFLPKLFFQTDYSYLAMKDDLGFSQEDFSKGFTSTVSLQVPLFQGFRSHKQYQKARIDYNILLDTQKQLSDAIIAEVEVAWRSFLEARQKFLSAEKTVALATESLRLATVMYEEGINTQLDITDARLALTRSRVNYANLLFDYQVARYQLRKSIGQLKGMF